MSLYHELKRRNVFRVAFAYLALAWLVTEVASTLFPTFGIPDWGLRFLVIVFALGLVPALIISWVYEITPEGLKREKDVVRDTSITRLTAKRLDLFTIGLIVVALAFILADRLWLSPRFTEQSAASAEVVTDPVQTPEPQLPEPDYPANSVAVLPFANMSAGENTAYFSDGLADTLLNMLAQVPGLRVPARTSSFKFRDYAGDISEIGDTLQVGAVLEGSVQLYGEKIRVTTQLIDTRTGYHLWSGNYDRNLSDIFAVQDTIAREVVSALRLTLLDETRERLDQTRSDNVEAYTEYLLGIDNLNPMTTESLERAAAHMQEAIELDPGYADALSALGFIYLDMVLYGSIRRAEGLARAKEAASRALEIAPESSVALAILGTVEMWDGDQETARQLLQKAIEKGPNNVRALQRFGMYAYSKLRDTEAEDVFRRALALDPLNDIGYKLLVISLRTQKRFPEALEVIAKWRKAVPESVNIAEHEAICYGLQGKYAAALQAVLTAPVDDPRDPEGPAGIAWIYLLMDMPDEAREWMDRAIERNPQHPVSLAAPLWLNFYQQQNEEESVWLARELLANRIERRRQSREVAVFVLLEYSAKSEQYENLLELLDNLYANLFDDPPYDLQKDWVAAFYVGLALIQSGDIDRGGHLLKAYLEWLDPSDEVDGPNWRSVAARLALGEKETAKNKFRELARVNKWWWPGIMSQTMLRHSSIFDPIRNEPEFIALLELYETNAAEQRRLVQEMGIH
jgi:adenylate cyclase